MRKMVKGAAIVGGVFSIIAALMSVTSIISLIRFQAPAAAYISSIAGILLSVLLAVILFRGKADGFAGVICLLHVPMHLSAVISNILTISVYLGMGETGRAISGGVNALAALVKTLAFVLMAVQCFRKQGGKSMACVFAAIAAAVLAVISTVGMNLVSVLGFGAGIELIFSAVIPALLGAVIGALPLIFAGIAIGGSTVPEPAVDYSAYQYPQYPQYPQYQQPQYPQYQEPQQYQYQEPQQYQYQDPQYPEQN